jgi:hypothetical protein
MLDVLTGLMLGAMQIALHNTEYGAPTVSETAALALVWFLVGPVLLVLAPTLRGSK